MKRVFDVFPTLVEKRFQDDNEDAFGSLKNKVGKGRKLELY